MMQLNIFMNWFTLVWISAFPKRISSIDINFLVVYARLIYRDVARKNGFEKRRKSSSYCDIKLLRSDPKRWISDAYATYVANVEVGVKRDNRWF